MNKEMKEVRPIHYFRKQTANAGFYWKSLIRGHRHPWCNLRPFSRSGTVSKYLLHTYDVISVDIQEYSKVLCEASTSLIDSPSPANEIIENIRNQ